MTTEPRSSSLRAIPSVDRVVRDLAETALPRPLVVAVVRRELERQRRDPAGDSLARIRAALSDLRQARLRPVINATGIIVHTNFGRSPLAPAAVDAVADAAANYTNLEYDLAEGSRGGRAAYLEEALAVLCAAESATIVNNCAAALVLVLRHLASRPPRSEVVISRGELVQIGGGFRVPDILEASGAALREVGTTNKTTLDDYRRALGERTALVLSVHRSNFYMGGFVESPTLEQIATVARGAGVPLLADLGSGATFDTRSLGGDEHEPTPAESLRAGADLVCFSGDKLLGGPQAGILAGRAPLIAALMREPFFRALRCDKLVMAALQATVDLLLNQQETPIRQMMQAPLDDLRRRAEAIAGQLAGLPGVRVEVGRGEAQVGGGSLPRTRLESVTLDLLPQAARIEDIAASLRRGDPPVVGYVGDARVKLDLRTVFPRQDASLIEALRLAFPEARP